VATPPTSVAIRAASAFDVEAIAALRLASWSAAYRGIVPDQFLHGITPKSRIGRWQRALSFSDSPVTDTTEAVDGDTVLGVCSSGVRRRPESSSVGEVYALHVEPGSWRRGIGTLLLDDSLGRSSSASPYPRSHCGISRRGQYRPGCAGCQYPSISRTGPSPPRRPCGPATACTLG